MKTLLLSFCILSSTYGFSQKQRGLATLDLKAFGGNNLDLKFGITMSGGDILKEPGTKKDEGILLGAGIGIFMFDKGDDPYIPIFLEVGYINRVKKIFPYLNIRGGYGLHKSGVERGGLYSEFRGGVSFKVGVCRFTPYAALTLIGLRTVANGETLKSSNEGMLSVGMAFVFGR